MTPDYEAAVDAVMQGPKLNPVAQAARVGFTTGMSSNPEAQAEALRVARRTGVPVDTVLAQPDEMRRQATVGAINFDTLARTAPATAALLADIEKAKLAHDNVSSLASIEALVGKATRFVMGADEGGGLPGVVGRSGSAMASGGARFNEGVWGAVRAGAEAMPMGLGDPVRDAAAKYGRIQRGAAEGLMPQTDNVLAAGYYSGMQSLGMSLVQMPLLIGGGAPLLTSMGVSTGGQAYGEARDKGVGAPAAAVFGVSQGLIEAGTERIGLPALMNLLKPGSVGKKALEYMLKEQGGEQIATHLQDLNEWAVLHPEKTLGDYLRERPNAAIQTAIAAAVGGGGQVAVVKGVERLLRDKGRLDSAEQSTQTLEALGKMAAADKLLQRDTSTFEQFIAAAAEDGPVSHVFIDGQVLMQSGLAEQLAQVSPSVAEQVQHAAETGGLVSIPVSEYVARIAATEFAQPLMQHLKTDPDGPSRAEAQAYMQGPQSEALRGQIEQAMAQAEASQTVATARDEIKAGFVEQLASTGRFRPEVNERYATLLAHFYVAQADRAGLTPQELAQRYPLRVQAKAAQGDVTMEQAGALGDVRAAWGALGVDSTLNEKGGVITLSRIVVPEGSRGAGVGTQAMARLIAYADATGQTIALTPSVDFGASSKARLVKFYKALGFTENKGRRKDFAISEAMVRPAQGGATMSQGPRAQIVFGADITAQPSVITLFEGADLSSFLHEAGHFFLQAQADMAARIDAQQREGAGATPQEQGMLDDTRALLQWFGLSDTPEASALTQWLGMPADQQREHHERFARGFEAYLFEGKAPSVELQALFQRFRAWLVSVYKEIKGLNVKLDDTVRGVMDRMLASSEQIAVAEAARDMAPLFETAQQAGWSEAQFAEYQAQVGDAPREASADLAARSLRDMRLMHGARGRALKALQKEAEGLRREEKLAARRDIMSRPVYQAWQFLTRKLQAGDKPGAPLKVGASSDTEVDPQTDSLLVAIAKLGGLQRAAATSDLGVHADDYKTLSGVFGKPVFRKDGGRTADRMAEALAELGYLATDENGKHSLHDLETAIDEELHGNPQYSLSFDYNRLNARPGDQVLNPGALEAGRLDVGELMVAATPEHVALLKARRMTAANGLHPDIVAERFGFTSGDELVRALAAANPPHEEIEALADLRMLEKHGELATPQALERAADAAVHNDVRARVLAAEANALAKATGSVKVLREAARQHAQALVGRIKVRDLRPSRYASAAAVAGRNAAQAHAKGETMLAATHKRNQLLQHTAASEAHKAREEVDAAVRYLKGLEGDIKALDADYADQIHGLLERFDLRTGQSLRTLDKRTALLSWVQAQKDAGFEPDIPEQLLDEAMRTSYKNLTVDELRGLVDTVRLIEHLGRTKNRLLTARDQREYEAIRDELVASIEANARGRTADTRTAADNLGRAVQTARKFGAAHLKAAMLARVLDGGQDGGPMWEHFVRAANERGDWETTMRADATARLGEILGPVFKLGKMGGKGVHFPGIARSLNREQRLAIALNVGNAGNLQRLLDGEGWTRAQLEPVLQTLTAAEWQAVQAVWDRLESYKPLVAAKERRVHGKEPNWVEATPFDVTTADGQAVSLRGGYYPVKYDPAASQRAEEHADAEDARRQLQGAYTSATTRRSFTKARAEEVKGRPLLYSLAGTWQGVNEVIHDLAWHEWLIDANRLLKSRSIDTAIRAHYGPEVKQQFKTWVQDIAAGDNPAATAAAQALGQLRKGVSIAGLGFNVMSAAVQPLGFTQSVVRLGPKWAGRGLAQFLGSPLATAREVNERSEFMRNRARTRFRELNEIRNMVQDQSALQQLAGRYGFVLMMRAQQTVDYPTWWGGYEKALAAGNDEQRAAALADQAVIDAQGSGMTKDLAAIERGGQAERLFTVFYSFMNTALNLGVAQAANGTETPAKKAKLVADMLLLYVVPAVLITMLKAGLTPGDAEDEDDIEGWAKKFAAAQIDQLFGLVVVGREFGEAAKMALGLSRPGADYSGPAGLRVIVDAGKLAQQASQGDADTAFRKALVNLVGSAFGLPSAQVNRSWTGVEALAEGETSNPAAVVFGFEHPR